MMVTSPPTRIPPGAPAGKPCRAAHSSCRHQGKCHRNTSIHCSEPLDGLRALLPDVRPPMPQPPVALPRRFLDTEVFLISLLASLPRLFLPIDFPPHLVANGCSKRSPCSQMDCK